MTELKKKSMFLKILINRLGKSLDTTGIRTLGCFFPRLILG